MRSITIIGVFCCLVINLQAQDSETLKKSSCQPSSCGPEGTKVAEAAIISHLRNESLTLHQAAGAKSEYLAIQMSKVDARELKGTNDQESVALIADFLDDLHQVLVKNIPEGKLKPTVAQLDFNVEESGARAVSKLSQNVLILQEQVNAL